MRTGVAIAALLVVGGCGTSPAVIDAATDASAPWMLPTASPRCGMPSDRAVSRLSSVSDAVPMIAIARGPRDLGLAYVVRPTPPYVMHLDFQRLALDGTPTGASVRLGPIDMSVPQPVTIAHDGAAYVACTVIVGGVSCFRIDASDHASEDGMIFDAIAIAIANGPGGVVAAWRVGDQLYAGPLGTSTPSMIATTSAAPTIAATDTGYVLGYAAGSSATVATLSSTGTLVSTTTLGTVQTDAPVVVAFSNGAIGASFVGPNGDAMAAVAGTPAITIGPGALMIGAGAQGQVSIARASDGFFATWSDVHGFVGGTFVDVHGAASGTAYTHAVSSDDVGHAIIATDVGWVLATITSPTTPVELARIGCP